MMLEATTANRAEGVAVQARMRRLVTSRPGLVPRLQLFGLLVLLAPLFAGLQHLVANRPELAGAGLDGPASPVAAPAERIVERVVERIVYVPVPADEVREGQTPGPAVSPMVPGTLPSAAEPASLPEPVFRPAP
jgi:hypothetical protein